MNPFTRTKWVAIGAFIVASLGAFGYQAYYIWPAQKCEKGGDWWDPKDHQCLTPIPVWRFTGRLPRAPGAEPTAAHPAAPAPAAPPAKS